MATWRMLVVLIERGSYASATNSQYIHTPNGLIDSPLFKRSRHVGEALDQRGLVGVWAVSSVPRAKGE